MSTNHTQPEINNFELTPQEEIDCEDIQKLRQMMTMKLIV